VCIGDEATITINNAVDYTDFVWTPMIGTTGSVTFTPDSTFTYFVEATDATGCKSQAVFEVVVNQPPTISMSGSTTFCEGGTASITASGGAMYDWTSPTISGFPTTGATITVSEPGDVTLVMTDANGCTSDSTITFTQEDIITINLGDVNICDGMGDTIFVNPSFINIEWYDATPTLVSDTSFYVITGAGTFTVQAIDGTTGCDATGSFEVMDFMTPMISVTDTVEVCRLDSGIDSLCVNFNNQVSGSAGVWSQITQIPGFTVVLSDLNDVCFEGAQSGCYGFRYTTNTAQAPCMNVMETMIVCVKACPCPSPATQPIAPMCNIGTKNLELSEVTSDPGTWSVESGPAGQDLTGILTGKIFNASGLLAGDYVVRFTLDNPGTPPACLQFSEQTLTVFAAPMITANDAFMCNVDNGTDPTVLDLFTLISVDATDGGTWMQIDGPTVTLAGGSTIMSSDLSTFPDTLTFTYTSGVEMGSPCPPAVVTVEVVVRDCNCPFIAVLADTLCNNGGLIDLNGLLLNPDGLAGTWSTTGTLVGTDMFDPNGLPSGLYTITYTLNVSPGPTCDIAYMNTILIRRQSRAVAKTSIAPCSADTGNGATTSNLYNWLESGYSSGTWSQTGGTPTLTFTDNGLNMAVVDFDGQPIGSMFTFTFTTIDAQDPCTNVSVDVTITVVDCNCPPIVLAPADDLCNLDGMIDLCALSAGSDPGTFTVMSIGGTDFSDRISADGCIFDATGLNPGEFVITFTLDQTVSGICEQFLQVNFNVVQYLTATIQDPPEVCSDPDGNGLMSLNFTTYVSNAGSGVWEDTDGAGVAIATLPEQQNVSFIGVPAGQYTFTYTIDNADPCEDVVLTMEVSVTDDCNCPSINPLNPSDECNTDGPIDLTQYDDPIRAGTWSSTDLTIENGNSLIIDGVVSGTYILLYTIEEIVEDCDSTAEVLILIGEPGNAGSPTAAYRLCEGVSDVVSLESLLEGEDLGGVWTETSGTSSGGFSGVDGTLTTDNAVAGTYTFEYTLSNNDPCPEVSATVTVIIDANPIADAGQEKFIDCINSSAMLGGGNTTTGSTIEYTWVNTTTGEDLGTTQTIEVSNAGTYELTVLNTETGCSSRSTVDVVKSDDLPTMLVTTMDISCFNAGDGGITISEQSGGDGNYTYTLGTTVTTDPNDFASLIAGDYMIEIMDGNGCSQSYNFTINEPPLFAINAGPDLEGDVGEEFTLTIEPFDTTGITSLTWAEFETTNIICTGLNCVTITVNPIENVTNYYVTAVDANGCEAVDEVQIRTQQIVDVVFPNIITPNGDNTNDRFYIKSKDVETVISMKIFDRWGEKLFDASNFPPRDPSYGWDGKFKDRKVVPGVYVFTVEILFVNGDKKTFSGDVTVTDSE
jgi:gliding motility-associated-like protein